MTLERCMSSKVPVYELCEMSVIRDFIRISTHQEYMPFMVFLRTITIIHNY